HSVSAFCSAGFSPFSSNLESFRDHLVINATISILSLFGAFGFLLSKPWFSKIFRSFALAAIGIGAILFAIVYSFANGTSEYNKLLISFFQTISAISTTGFNTIDFRMLSNMTLIVVIFQMLVGACLTSSGTNTRI